MKHKLILILLSLTLNIYSLDILNLFDSDCKNYTYCKLGGAALYSVSTGAQFSLGKRYEEEDHALDLSLVFFKAPNGISFSLPKICYLYILSPDECSSFYRGIGLSLGGILRDKPQKTFIGLKTDFIFGYDLQREGLLRSFVELGISQSVLSISQKSRLFLPELTFSYGIGY